MISINEQFEFVPQAHRMGDQNYRGRLLSMFRSPRRGDLFNLAIVPLDGHASILLVYQPLPFSGKCQLRW